MTGRERGSGFRITALSAGVATASLRHVPATVGRSDHYGRGMHKNSDATYQARTPNDQSDERSHWSMTPPPWRHADKGQEAADRNRTPTPFRPTRRGPVPPIFSKNLDGQAHRENSAAFRSIRLIRCWLTKTTFVARAPDGAASITYKKVIPNIFQY